MIEWWREWRWTIGMVLIALGLYFIWLSRTFR
jgi:hypothetical protein